MLVKTSATQRLNALLAAWHKWAASEKMTVGYPAQVTLFKGYRDGYGPEPFDDGGTGGMVDDAVNRVGRIDHLRAIALQREAALQVIGADVVVWRRLPTGDALRELARVSRNALGRELAEVIDYEGGDV